MPTAGLSLEQAPHLSIPASFFLTVPVSLVVAGCILILAGAVPFRSPWSPQVVALTHMGTVGVLGMGMIGALYQMTPVVAGAPVPAIRFAHGVHVLLLLGLAFFVWRLLGGPASAMTLASYSLGAALLGFLLPVGWSLGNSATRSETVLGMRLAVASLAAIAVMGLLLAGGYADKSFPESRFLWTQVHLTLALLGWVGGLIMSVSWQVIPMFYLAPSLSRRSQRIMLGALIVGLMLPFAAFTMGTDNDIAMSPTRLAATAALPAALVVWFFHPLLTLLNIHQRKRKRSDASLLFWRAGLGVALLLVPLAAVACLVDDQRWQILLGWLAIWGWAGHDPTRHVDSHRAFPRLVSPHYATNRQDARAVDPRPAFATADQDRIFDPSNVCCLRRCYCSYESRCARASDRSNGYRDRIQSGKLARARFGELEALSDAALVDDPQSLAPGAWQATRFQHFYRHAHANVGPDIMTQRFCQDVALFIRRCRSALDADRQMIEFSPRTDDELVVGRQLAVLQHLFLDLTRKQVDATDDQHVITARRNSCDAAHGTTAT